MWTNRVLMCGIDILLCLWAVYLFFFYFDIFFARKRKRYLSVIGITLFVIWQFGITTIISFPAYINIAVTIMFTFLAVMMTYVQIPLHRITDSASNGSVFPVVTEHFSASSDHAFL